MQNINLYQRERRRKGGPRPWQMWLGVSALALFMLSHAGVQGWQLHYAGESRQRSEEQAQAAEARLAAFKADYREPKLDAQLPIQLAEREAENRQLQRLASHLQTLDSQLRDGFVPVLTALSDRHPPSGLWLTRIRLQAGGSDLLLRGLSQNQELLPLYLESLGRSAALRGREFASFDLQREDNGLLRFRLSSRADKEAADE
ncbi:PilN domain-containing protein [Pseudomonas lopnurensis]|uniref:PilN domain-containing protein n=1 Tax=Pseudomonas lopnurensis TaxID=1477517 RepID=UPI00187A21CA|nr:PilN domain-containing protein [Pseudomonas lopnurensis]MBE7374775.1 PilN domain-containing protein [Pseudomonas lopnurensis]